MYDSNHTAHLSNATTGSLARVRAHLVARFNLRASAVVAVLTAALAALGLFAPAQAVTATNNGYTGSVSYGHFWGGASGNASSAPSIIAAAPTVSKVSAYAGYNQYVCATYRLWRTSGSTTAWAALTTLYSCGWISGSATKITLGSATWGATEGFYYTGDITISWRLSNGSTIGTKRLDYTSASDYGCMTDNCWTFANTAGRAGIMFPNYYF